MFKQMFTRLGSSNVNNVPSCAKIKDRETRA